MKNRIYTYFFHEFIRYFAVTLFALTAVLWTIQAVNFLDLVTDDGHAFKIYIFYSFLTLPKIITKLIPLAFLGASLLTILKLEKDNELIILWTSGLNKINIVNLVFRISLLIMFFQFVMASFINPQTLNFSRSLIKNSELQFVSSLLRVKQFNDAVVGLTIFVDKKNPDGSYENIFIRDEGNVLTTVSGGTSTIIAKYANVSEDQKSMVLVDGNIQKLEKNGEINVVKFEKTKVTLSGLSTKSIAEPKIQETSTLQIIKCFFKENKYKNNCEKNIKNIRDSKIELNRRFGMPFFIPLIALLTCFLLASRKDKKNLSWNKYIYFGIGFFVLVCSEITVRYSGSSILSIFLYYFIPIGLLPIVYLTLLRKFKYENLN